MLVDFDEFLRKSMEMPRTLEITFGIKPKGVSSSSWEPVAYFTRDRIHSHKIHPPTEYLLISKGLKNFCVVYFCKSVRISAEILFICTFLI